MNPDSNLRMAGSKKMKPQLCLKVDLIAMQKQTQTTIQSSNQRMIEPQKRTQMRRENFSLSTSMKLPSPIPSHQKRTRKCIKSPP